MKHLKRWLALAASAALALSLLTGCCGSIRSNVLFRLMKDQLENVQVDTDSKFDQSLKAAVQQGGTDPKAVAKALAEELSLTAQVEFTISALTNATAGQQALNVVFESGSDVNTAAMRAAVEWLLVLRGLPQDGAYSARVGAVRTEGGYILAIHLTVEEPGTLPPDPEPDQGYTVSEDGKTYEVYTADGLLAWNKAAQGDLSLSCTLTDNIDLTGIDWTPIGTFGNEYTGTFDGKDKTITGLTVNGSDGRYYFGLFGSIGSGGTVKDLTLADVSINAKDSIGGVAGENNGTIENCQVTGGTITVNNSGTGNAGGIAGVNNGIIKGCSSAATVKDACNTGGVVGLNYNQVIACYSTGTVSGGNSGDGTNGTGGVAGQNNSGTITACYHAGGNVSAPRIVGGVVGYNTSFMGSSGIVDTCYWSNSLPNGIGSLSGGRTETYKVDDADVTWADAVDGMNAALRGTGWQYELTGALPTLK